MPVAASHSPTACGNTSKGGCNSHAPEPATAGTHRGARESFHHDEAEKALTPIRRLLASRGVPCTVHVEVGSKAQLIANTARRLQCDHILMSTARKNSLTRMIEDSVTNKVLEITTVPVRIIAGDATSRWERYGIPVSLGTAVGLFLLAAA